MPDMAGRKLAQNVDLLLALYKSLSKAIDDLQQEVRELKEAQSRRLTLGHRQATSRN